MKKINCKILTAQEVGDFLKLPLSTVYALTKRGVLRGIKLGKHWRYIEAEIHDHLLGIPNGNGHGNGNGNGHGNGNGEVVI